MTPLDDGKTVNIARETRILDVAADLIAHYGYDKTTVSDIAREAGISKGAIYLHFTSKDELFEALIQREIMRYGNRWLELLDDAPDGGTFGGIFKTIMIAMQENALILALFRRDQRVLGAFMRKDSTLMRFKAGVTSELLQAMQGVGAVRQDIQPEVTAHIINILSYGLVGISDVVPEDDQPPLEDTMQGLADMLDRALTAPDADPAAAKALIKQMTEAAQQQLSQRWPHTDDNETER